MAGHFPWVLVWTGACYWNGAGGLCLIHHHLRVSLSRACGGPLSFSFFSLEAAAARGSSTAAITTTTAAGTAAAAATSAAAALTRRSKVPRQPAGQVAAARVDELRADRRVDPTDDELAAARAGPTKNDAASRRGRAGGAAAAAAQKEDTRARRANKRGDAQKQSESQRSMRSAAARTREVVATWHARCHSLERKQAPPLRCPSPLFSHLPYAQLGRAATHRIARHQEYIRRHRGPARDAARGAAARSSPRCRPRTGLRAARRGVASTITAPGRKGTRSVSPRPPPPP